MVSSSASDGENTSAAATPAAGVVFAPVQTPRASEMLADRIREWILDGHHPDGTMLPSERKLMEQTGLGRSTIREALRVLQSEGLLSSKLGPKGGYVVRRPGIQTIIDSMSVFVRGRRLELASLMEARQAVEPACAAAAALRATPEEIDSLKTLAERLADPSLDGQEVTDANLEWHLAVVRASHNDLLIAFVSAISIAMRTAVHFVHVNLGDASPAVRPDMLLAHRKISDAIAARDPDAAERRMRKHLAGYSDLIAKTPLPESPFLDADHAFPENRFLDADDAPPPPGAKVPAGRRSSD